MVIQLAQAWHFVGLELAVGAAFALTLVHAIQNRKSGALFQWLTALFYGITIELLAFNFLNNYIHGRFTVQLYHGKLPLYVTFWYPALHYTGLKLVESWKLGRISEASAASRGAASSRWRAACLWLIEPFLVGFSLMLLDIPFDIVGPDAGWWRWTDTDPNLAARWLGVPINSYYWYLLFGAIYAALTRAMNKKSLLWTPLVGILIIPLGRIAFEPFHLLKAAHVPDDLIVGAHIVFCFGLAWTVRPVKSDAPGMMKICAALLQLYPAILGILFFRTPAKVAMSLAAIVALLPFQRRMFGHESAGADSDSRRLQRRSL